ncbi:MAG: lipid II:glycine glycyltransferase FemX [Chthoniobacterales bacterium]
MNLETPAIGFPSNAALLSGRVISHIPAVGEHTIIDPRFDETWEREIADHGDATIFHTSAWAQVLCETYRHTPLYLRFANGGKPSALLPLMEVASPLTGRRGVSLPFSDSCAPLIFAEAASSHTIVDTLVDLAKERRWKYFEMRSMPATASALAPNKTFYAHKLDLKKSSDELFANLESAARRAIRKAERSSLSVEISRDEKAIEQFYSLHSRTRRRHGVPPQPRAFFRNIHTHIIKQGLGFVVLARRSARPIAGAVFFHFGKQALFKFGASDERDQEHRPNNLLMWEGIRHCAQLGFETLHLGRTDVGQDGLRRFKLSLGAQEEMLRYFRFDPSAARWLPESSAFSSPFSAAVVRRLPLTINQLAGTVLYPHLH